MTITARYQSGELDQRVELQYPVKAPNGQGGYDITWEPHLPVWAKVKPLTGGERSQADRLAAEGGYMVTIRNLGISKDVNETWRVRWLNEDRIFNIRFVHDAGQRDIYRMIDCESGVAT